MNIAVIGTGYVGLVTGACFSEFGVHVTCVDNNMKKLEMLTQGKVPFYEPGLDELVQKNIKAGRLTFTSDLAAAIGSALVVFIAVGTPPKKDGKAEMKFVHTVAKEIGRNMNGYKVIVTKSTVPVGTGKKIKKLIEKTLKSNSDFDVVSNPEFLREGAAIDDFMRPDRVVIGVNGKSGQAEAIMRDLYRPLYLIETPIIVTDIETAELIKYASNGFLATKISFINEIANLCEAVGADVQIVAKAMGLDKRIGQKFLHAGPGYGGSCFPKDTLALLQVGKESGVQMGIIEATVVANNFQKDFAAKKIIVATKKAKGRKICILGLSFKPKTDDIRDSAAIYVVKKLLAAGFLVNAVDPEASANARVELGANGNIGYFEDIYTAVAGSDGLVIATEWNQFRNLDLEKLKKLMKGNIFFDLRNIYAPEKVRELGFQYHSTGRK